MQILLASIIANPDGPSTAISSCFGITNVDVCPQLCLAGTCINPTCNVPLPVINVSCIGNEITSTVNSAASALTTLVNNLTASVNGIANDVVAEMDSLSTTVTGIAGSIDTFVTDTATDFGNATGNVIADVTNFATTIAGDITNFVDNTVIAGITNLVGEAESLIDALPGSLQGFLDDIINGALNGVGLDPTSLTPAGLVDLLSDAVGVVADNLPTLPSLPCPADGSSVPAFGEVGELVTSLEYQKYLWVFQLLFEILPESEYTAPVLVPLGIGFVGFDFLGRCLDQAAGNRSGAATEDFRTLVLGAFDSLSIRLMTMNTNLTSNLNLTETTLTDQINQSRADLLDLLDMTDTDVTNRLNTAENKPDESPQQCPQ